MSAFTPAALEALTQRLHGEVFVPGPATPAPGAFNATLTQNPALVATPADEQDIGAVVEFAREHGLQVAPQRTGHNAAPLGSLAGTILLRTDRLTGVEIDPERRLARVRAGSTWQDVVPAAAEHGLAALHGSAQDVSVAGYTLGGGIGWYGRKHGLAANSVTAIELVTADGRLRRTDHEHHPELFWALRGGGGNFGIVTAVEFQLYEAPEVYAGAMFFPWERSAEVLRAWLRWTRTAPDEVTSVGRVLQFPPLPEIPEPLRGQKFAIVEVAFLGGKDAGDELVEPLRELHPVMDTIAMVPPTALAGLHMDPPEPLPYLGDSQLLNHLDEAGIDAFVAAVGPGSGSALTSAEIRHLGGAFARPQAGQGSLGTVDAEFMTFGVGVLAVPELELVHQQALGLLAAALAPYDAGRQYLNFTETSTDAGRFFRPDVHHRLRSVKAAYDPDRLFRANHPITPAR
jgi:UDP-N-acetylenolpyruvoylglucosamine reductase